MSLAPAPPYRITIRSTDRVSGGPSDFVVRLDGVPAHAAGHNRVYLQGVSVPVSWYLIDSGRDTLELIEPGFPADEVGIPHGNYSAPQLIVALASALTAASKGGRTYGGALDRRTGRFDIQVDAGDPAGDPSLVCRQPRLARILGLPVNVPLSFVDGLLVATAPCACQISPAVQVLSSISEDGVLQDVFSTAPSFSYLEYENVAPELTSKVLTQPINNGLSVGIQLVDLEWGEPVSLNGQEWVLTLVSWRADDAPQRLLALKRARVESQMDLLRKRLRDLGDEPEPEQE